MNNGIRTLIAGIFAVVLSAGMATGALAGHPVNVNTATAEQLAEALDGVGQQKAQAIVDYRKANGPFAKADDLLNVKGIGEKMLEKNREYVKLK